jgi:hypothetical protein
VAIAAGLGKASGDLVIIMDSDLKHQSGLILELISQWPNGFDVVFAKRHGVSFGFSLNRILRRLFFRLIEESYPLFRQRIQFSLIKFISIAFCHQYPATFTLFVGYLIEPPSIVN